MPIGGFTSSRAMLGRPRSRYAHLGKSGDRYEQGRVPFRSRQRFVKRHGITGFQFTPFFPVNTLAIMRGAIAAQKLGVFKRYVDEVFRHMWAEPKKLDDPEVLRAALLESALDADRLLQLAQRQDVKDELLANTRQSVERGTFGSPTFFVGDEIFFGKDRLRDVETALIG